METTTQPNAAEMELLNELNSQIKQLKNKVNELTASEEMYKNWYREEMAKKANMAEFIGAISTMINIFNEKNK